MIIIKIFVKSDKILKQDFNIRYKLNKITFFERKIWLPVLLFRDCDCCLDGSDESINVYFGVIDGQVVDNGSICDVACIDAEDADKKFKSLPSITSKAISEDEVVRMSSLDEDSVVLFCLWPF